MFSWCADWDATSSRGAKFSWCLNDETGRHFPFDVMLPNLGVIVEVDGAHHFRNVANWGDNLAERQRRDVYKMQRAVQNGFRVIRICQEDVWKAQDYWKLVLHRAVHTGDKSVMTLAQQPSLYDEHWKLMGIIDEL